MFAAESFESLEVIAVDQPVSLGGSTARKMVYPNEITHMQVLWLNEITANADNRDRR